METLNRIAGRLELALIMAPGSGAVLVVYPSLFVFRFSFLVTRCLVGPSEKRKTENSKLFGITLASSYLMRQDGAFTRRWTIPVGRDSRT